MPLPPGIPDPGSWPPVAALACAPPPPSLTNSALSLLPCDISLEACLCGWGEGPPPALDEGRVISWLPSELRRCDEGSAVPSEPVGAGRPSAAWSWEEAAALLAAPVASTCVGDNNTSGAGSAGTCTAGICTAGICTAVACCTTTGLAYNAVVAAGVAWPNLGVSSRSGQLSSFSAASKSCSRTAPGGIPNSLPTSTTVAGWRKFCASDTSGWRARRGTSSAVADAKGALLLGPIGSPEAIDVASVSLHVPPLRCPARGQSAPSFQTELTESWAWSCSSASGISRLHGSVHGWDMQGQQQRGGVNSRGGQQQRGSTVEGVNSRGGQQAVRGETTTRKEQRQLRRRTTVAHCPCATV